MRRTHCRISSGRRRQRRRDLQDVRLVLAKAHQHGIPPVAQHGEQVEPEQPLAEPAPRPARRRPVRCRSAGRTRAPRAPPCRTPALRRAAGRTARRPRRRARPGRNFSARRSTFSTCPVAVLVAVALRIAAGRSDSASIQLRLHGRGVQHQGEGKHHVRAPLPTTSRSGVRSQRADMRERAGAVHARLHLVHQQQITPAAAGRRPGSGPPLPERAARRRRPGSVRPERRPPDVSPGPLRSARSHPRRTDRRR